jgi:hypothetical protein
MPRKSRRVASQSPPSAGALAEILQGVSEKLQKDFDHISAAIKHNPSKGKVRERQLAKEFLRKYLPDRFGITHGEIVSVDGQTSGECDLIIYDALVCPVLLKEEDYQIVPVEATYGVVEVKSKITSAELLKSAKNICAIKRMPKTAFSVPSSIFQMQSNIYGKTWNFFPVTGFLFGYRSIKLETLGLELEAFNQQISAEHRIDYVCALDKGGLTHTTEKGGLSFIATPTTHVGLVESDKPLTAWFSVMQNLLVQAWSYPVLIGDYLGKTALGRIRPFGPPATSSQPPSN